MIFSAALTWDLTWGRLSFSAGQLLIAKKSESPDWVKRGCQRGKQHWDLVNYTSSKDNKQNWEHPEYPKDSIRSLLSEKVTKNIWMKNKVTCKQRTGRMNHNLFKSHSLMQFSGNCGVLAYFLNIKAITQDSHYFHFHHRTHQ